MPAHGRHHAGMDKLISPRESLDQETLFIALEALCSALEEEDDNLIPGAREERIRLFLGAYITLHTHCMNTWNLYDNSYPCVEKYAADNGYTFPPFPYDNVDNLSSKRPQQP